MSICLHGYAQISIFLRIEFRSDNDFQLLLLDSLIDGFLDLWIFIREAADHADRRYRNAAIIEIVRNFFANRFCDLNLADY